MSENATDVPRVLIVTSNNFNLQAGGGITLSNLFRAWPSEALANLHEDPTIPDTSVCANFFRLTGREVQWAWPFSAVESIVSPRRVEQATNALAMPGSPRGWKRRLVGDGIPRDVHISAPLGSWIEAFRPQLVYGFLGSMAQMRIVRRIADRWKLPIAIHVMDDWPAVIYREGILSPILRPAVLHEFRGLLRRAAARLVISKAMAEEYERRYRYTFRVFHNALDITEWVPQARMDWRLRGRATIRYVGSIVGEAQRDALRDVVDAVASLRAAGRDVTLSVHAPESQTAVLRTWNLAADVLRIDGVPNPAMVPRLLGEADILVLPFNFDAVSRKYLKLSMPTKVPAYMVSATPILVYGPPEIATVQYAVRDGWGDCVTQRDGGALQDAIDRLVSDVAHREQLGRRASELARANHDAESVSLAFLSALTDAAARVSVGGE